MNRLANTFALGEVIHGITVSSNIGQADDVKLEPAAPYLPTPLSDLTLATFNPNALDVFVFGCVEDRRHMVVKRRHCVLLEILDACSGSRSDSLISSQRSTKSSRPSDSERRDFYSSTTRGN